MLTPAAHPPVAAAAEQTATAETSEQQSGLEQLLAQTQLSLAHSEKRNSVLEGLVKAMRQQPSSAASSQPTQLPKLKKKASGSPNIRQNKQNNANADTAATQQNSAADPFSLPEVADAMIMLLSRAEKAEAAAAAMEQRAVAAEAHASDAETKCEQVRKQLDRAEQQISETRRISAAIEHQMYEMQNLSQIQLFANEIEALRAERDSLCHQLAQAHMQISSQANSIYKTQDIQMASEGDASQEHQLRSSASVDTIGGIQNVIDDLRMQLTAAHDKLARAVALGKARDAVIENRTQALNSLERKLGDVFSRPIDTIYKRIMLFGNDPHRFHADHWTPDGSAGHCQADRCDVKFGFMQRRHHCRRCGMVMCALHLTQRMPLSIATKAYDPAAPVAKVCDACAVQARENATSHTTDFEVLLNQPETITSFT